MNPITIITGDSLTELPKLEEESVQCCVTSPPYWGLRDYGVPPTDWPEVTFVPVAGLPSITIPAMTCCHGLEPDPWAFVAHQVLIFQEVRRLLKKDGTCWVNLGDSYASVGKWGGSTGGKHVSALHGDSGAGRGKRDYGDGLKSKDLCGIPWMVAKALQADGWYLRQDIIWHKPNPMPESVTDRCTKAHEYIFLLTKSERYYYDAEAVLEPVSPNTNMRVSQNVAAQIGSERANGGAKTNGNMKAVVRGGVNPKAIEPDGMTKQNTSFSSAVCLPVLQRNKRSVWQVPTYSYSEAHFATYPPDLIKPCILAGSCPGDTVLDPFGGSGTTGQVALELGRKAILIELGPHNVDLIRQRTNTTPGLGI